MGGALARWLGAGAPRSRTGSLLLRVGALLTALAGSGLAQTKPAVADRSPVEDPRLELARQRFAEAVALEAREQWEAASERLREVLAVRETAGVRFHLAHCQENQGALLSALANYRRAAALNEIEPATDVAVLLGPALDRIDSRLPRVTIVVAAPDAILKVDGKRRPLGEPFALDPGSHRLEIVAPGFVATRRQIELREAEQRTLRAVLDPLPPPRELHAPAARVQTEARRVPGGVLATGVASVVAAGAGLTFTAARARASRRVAEGRSTLAAAGVAENSCTDPRTVDVERACWQLDVHGAARQRARSWQRISFAASGVGLAGLGGAWLWSRRSSRVAERAAAAGGVWVGVVAPSPEAGAVTVSGRF